MKRIAFGLTVTVLSVVFALNAFAIGIKGTRYFNPKYAFSYKQTCVNSNGTGGANFVYDSGGQKVPYPTKPTLYSPNVTGTDWTTYPQYTATGWNFGLDKPEEYLCP